MVGIISWGAYAPRLRLSRKAAASANAWIAPGLMAKAKGERSMANWDEDALTMAVEAARDALGPGDDRSHIHSLYYASTTAPFADRLNAGIISAALTLEKAIFATDVTGSQRCGITALSQALTAAKSGGTALVAAGEHRRARAASTQELDWGDGGAAFVVGSGTQPVAELLGHGVITDDFVDHFRGSDSEFDYSWEERWIRDEGIVKLVPPAIKQALNAAGIGGEQVKHFCFPSTFAGMAANLAKLCAIPAESVTTNLAAEMGEAGSAHGLIMLAHALEHAEEGDIILVAQFGQGAEALVFRATRYVKTRRPARGVHGSLNDRKEETNYLKFLFFNGLVEWDMGMRAEKDNKTALTTLYRNSDMILGLVGGRCTETGVVQFPRSRISVAPNNPAVDTQEPYKFADRKGSVLSYSADYLTFAMAPPNHYGMIVFEGGGRIFMDITDVEPGDVDSGLPVRMVFRKKETDDKRGFQRYFWKAVPDRSAAAKAVAE